MNKHTATNPANGMVYTRNSATRVYAYCVVGVLTHRDGSKSHPLTGDVSWTSRMDLAQKIASKNANELHRLQNSPYPDLANTYQGATVETLILEAVLKP
jgi:hypothetical protein